MSITKSTTGRGGFIYNDESSFLPDIIADELNITYNGAFTEEGTNVVEKYCNNFSSFNYTTLSIINDNAGLNHEQIGKLIEYLAGIEREQKIEMFLSPKTEE